MADYIRREQKDVQIDSKAHRIVIRYSALGGVLQLLPIPFVDDILIGQAHEHMTQALFEHYGLTLEEQGQDILKETPSNFIKSIMQSMVMMPIKKILKKFLYVLTIRGVFGVFSSFYHDGWLLAKIIEDELVDMQKLADNDEQLLREVRAAIIETKKQIDTRPLIGGLKLGWQKSKEALASLLTKIESQSFDQNIRLEPQTILDAKEMKVVEDRMYARLNDEGSYHQRLEDVLKQHLFNPSQAS